MATKLNKRTVVIVGGGLTAALVARQLTAKGTDVLVLERGADRRNAAAAKLPNQRDELRWDIRGGLGQDWSIGDLHDPPQPQATKRCRHAGSLRFCPATAWAAPQAIGTASPGDGRSMIRRCAPASRRATASRRSPRTCRSQDWGVTYAEMEPYHHLFEKLYGLSGKAGNIKGAISPAAIRSKRRGATTIRSRRSNPPKRG